MALNITEATAVNRLYDWLVARDSGIGRTSDEDARAALATLARGAHRALMAGVTEQHVTDTPRWPALEEPRAEAPAPTARKQSAKTTRPRRANGRQK